jgi:uncharacterized membrane protein
MKNFNKEFSAVKHEKEQKKLITVAIPTFHPNAVIFVLSIGIILVIYECIYIQITLSEEK